MATLTTQNITRLGIAESLVAAAGGGDACEVGQDMMLKVVNGGGSSINVTLAIPAGASSIPNVPYTSAVIAVANGAHRWIKIGPEMRDPTTGLCTITYSGVTSVTVGAFRLSAP